MAETKKPFHEAVAEKLIEQLKQGTAPWQRPWEPGESAAVLPMNPSTGKRYKGINSIYLMAQSHDDQRWMTYKQAAAMGAQVRKGERGTSIQYWKFADEKERRDSQGRPVLDGQGRPMMDRVELERPRVFFATVFNAEQIDGLPPMERKTQEMSWTALERAEAILMASGAVLRHSSQNTAFYRPNTDSIHMPDRSQFPTADNYYATALHELGHWTGHPSRLARDLSHPFGSVGYAKEELRAEIASMILGDELGIGHDPGQHAAYVNSWIKVLEDDPMEVIRAAADAEKIQGFVMSLEQAQQQQQGQQQPAEPLEVEAALLAQLTEMQLPDPVPLRTLPGRSLVFSNEPGLVGVEVLNQDGSRLSIGGREAIEAFVIEHGLQPDERRTMLDMDALADPYRARVDEAPEPVPLHTLPGRVIALDESAAFVGVYGVVIKNEDGSSLPLHRSNDIQRFAAENALAMDEVRALLDFEAIAESRRIDAPPPSPLRSPQFQSTEGQPGRLYDRVTGVLGLQDAIVAGTWRDLQTATAATRPGDAEEFQRASRSSFGFELPADWSGHIQVQANVMHNGRVEPADLGADQRPEFYGVYAQRQDGTHVHLQDMPTLEPAEELAQRLGLVDGHAEINKLDQAAKLAALRAAAVRRDPSSSDEDRDIAKEAAKEASFVASQADPATLEREARLQRDYELQALYQLEPQQMTAAEFASVAQATKLESHGRQWEVAFNGLTGFSDATTADDAVREYHKASVNNALFSHSPQAPVTMTRAALPPPHVLAEYPDVLARFPDAALTPDERATRVEKTFLNVPFKEKNAAKDLGAKWDRAEQSWYVPAGVDPSAFGKWAKNAPERQQEVGAAVARPTPAPARESVPTGRQYLAVPYEARSAAKAAGAQWDKTAKSWYVAPGVLAQPEKASQLQQWLPDRVAAQQDPAMTPREEAANALRDLGLVVDGLHPIMDGKPHRVPVDGGKKGAVDGFYVMHDDGRPAGFIKNNLTGDEQKWVSKGYTLSEEQKAVMRSEAAANLVKREQEVAAQQERVADRVLQQLDSLRPVDAATPYIAAKGIAIHPGAFTDRDNKTTYIPAIDANNKLWTMQYIQDDGTKRFAKDGRKEGCFHAIGGLAALERAPILVIAEGYATAATLTETLGYATVAAFDSGNLSAVATALHAKFPEKPVIVAGDDDRALVMTHGVNAGRVKANDAAQAVGGVAMFPIFAPKEASYPDELAPVTPQQYREHLRRQDDDAPVISDAQLAALSQMKKFTDFNDLARKSELGPEAVARQVRAVASAVEARQLVSTVLKTDDERLVQTAKHRPSDEPAEPRRTRRAAKL